MYERIVNVTSLKQLKKIRDFSIPTTLNLKNLKEKQLLKDDFPSCRVNLTKLILPDSLEYLDSRICENSPQLEIVENAPMLRFIGDEAFLNCGSLVSFPFSPSISFIGNSAFQFCTSLKEVSIMNILEIRKACFDYCTALEKLTLHGVKIIGPNAFSLNMKLKTIHIPETVEKIGNLAFQASLGLERLIVMPMEPPIICQETFTCCSFKEILVKTDALEKYKSAKNWDKFASIIKGFEDTDLHEEATQ